MHIKTYRELPGKGPEGGVAGWLFSMGSLAFVLGGVTPAAAEKTGGGVWAEPAGTHVYIAIDHHPLGYFHFSSVFRPGIREMVSRLSPRLGISVVSGDTARERGKLAELFGPGAVLMFGQKPERKMRYIEQLQAKGEKVLMIGDGLNDAGALSQSNVGIALAGDLNQFTPASDIILQADGLSGLPAILRLCKAGRFIILASFMVSILYNVAGLYFAVRGSLSPMVAAILMPASSITILLVTYGASWLAGRLLFRRIASNRMPSS
jgi:Cu+-exporting ATPase